jgi:hypothetical protein
MLSIRSDNGTDFQAELALCCERQDVHRQYSDVYTPEQNCRTERTHRDPMAYTHSHSFVSVRLAYSNLSISNGDCGIQEQGS